MKPVATVLTALSLLSPLAASAQLMRVELVSHDLISEANYNSYDGHNLQPAGGQLTLETFVWPGRTGDLVPESWNQWHLFGDVERLGHFDLKGTFNTAFSFDESAGVSSLFFQADGPNYQFFGGITFASNLNASLRDGFIDLRLWPDGTEDNRAQALSATVYLTPVPEPSTYGIAAGVSLLLVAWLGRSRRTAAAASRQA